MSVKEKLTALADVIREKTGTSAAMTLDDMIAAVKRLSLSDTGDSSDVGKSTESAEQNS